jgi:predicted transcriptional regulator
MKKLTETEEKIMQILWEINNGFVKDVISKFSNPKPPYTTISSVIRILEQKGFVSHKQYGNTYEYFPAISRDEYKKSYLKNIVQDYFGNSYQQLVSFFAKEEEVNIDELQEILEMIKSQKLDRND